MKRHRIRTKLSILILVTLIFTAFATTTAMAQGPALEASYTERGLPPLPEWPIVGPILRRLGLATQPVEILTPDPSLPEYRIRTPEDIKSLEEIEPGERVRIVASDKDLNRMIQDALEAQEMRETSMILDFDTGTLQVEAKADESLVTKTGMDVPRQLRGDLDLSTKLTLSASDCVPTVRVERIHLNRWALGLRPIAQRMINARLPEVWPDTICVERVLLMPGEAAVEGYRK
ncbi:MAG: hypothetical protein ACP5HS_08225 [Anaerolineae bacterium]